MSSIITRSKSKLPENELIAHQTLVFSAMGVIDDIYYLLHDSGLHTYPFVTVDLYDPWLQLPTNPNNPNYNVPNPYLKLIQNFEQHCPRNFTMDELCQFTKFRGSKETAERYLDQIDEYSFKQYQTIRNQLSIWFTIPRFRELFQNPRAYGMKWLEVELPERNLIFDKVTFSPEVNGSRPDIVLYFHELASTADR